MGIGPITFLEIEAYQRLQLVSMTAWEVALLRRLDDAVRVVMSADTKGKAKPKPEAVETQIPADKPSMIKSLFRGIAARKAVELQTQEAAK